MSIHGHIAFRTDAHLLAGGVPGHSWVRLEDMQCLSQRVAVPPLQQHCPLEASCCSTTGKLQTVASDFNPSFTSSPKKKKKTLKILWKMYMKDQRSNLFFSIYFIPSKYEWVSMACHDHIHCTYITHDHCMWVLTWFS